MGEKYTPSDYKKGFPGPSDYKPVELLNSKGKIMISQYRSKVGGKFTKTSKMMNP